MALFFIFSLVASQLSGSQAIEQSEKKVMNVLTRTEHAVQSAIAVTSKLALRSVALPVQYPRLTLLAITVVPMAIPQCRAYVQRSSSRMMRIISWGIGKWAQRHLHGWLVGSTDDQIECAQEELHAQHKILDEHTQKLETIKETADKGLADMQILQEQQRLMDERVSTLAELAARHNKLLESIGLKTTAVHEQVKLSHAEIAGHTSQLSAIALQEEKTQQGVQVAQSKLEDLEVLTKGNFEQLAAMEKQEGATAEHVQKITVTLDELYARLAALDGHVSESKAQTLEKIQLLEKHLGELSEDQKHMFEEYGAQFAVRFDQLSENLRLVLSQMVERQPISCGQQHLVALKH